MARLHAPDPRPDRVALCGAYAVELVAASEAVTCPGCLRELRAGAPVAAPRPDSFVPPPPAPATFGARELERVGQRALADSAIERDAPRQRWSSVDAAVRAWVRMRDEGASLRSTSDPDRANRVQTSKDPSLGGREHDAVERTATVARALDTATRSYPLALSAACEVLEPEQCRSVYLLSVVGKARHDPIRQGRAQLKQRCWRRVSKSMAQVAEVAAETYEQPVTERHVLAIRRHYFSVILDALVASGEMRAPRARGPRRGSFAAGPAARVRETG